MSEDLKEFLLSEEFRDYHRRQAQEIAACLYNLLDSGQVQDVKGAMIMARRLQELPLSIYQAKEFNESVKQRLKNDYAEITTALTRRYLEG